VLFVLREVILNHSKGFTLEKVEKVDRLLRLPEVIERTRISRSTIYTNMSIGKFPKQIKPSPGCVGWRESDIEAVVNGKWKSTISELSAVE
jgi:prophage regulatory protein